MVDLFEQGFFFQDAFLDLIARFIEFVMGFEQVLPKDPTQEVDRKKHGQKGEPGPGFQRDTIGGDLKIPHFIEKKKGEHQQIDDKEHLPVFPGVHIAGKNNDGQHKNEGALYAPAEEGDDYGRDHGQDGGRQKGGQQVLMALVQQSVHKIQKGKDNESIGNHPPDVQKEKPDDPQNGSDQGGAVIYFDYQIGPVLKPICVLTRILHILHVIL